MHLDNHVIDQEREIGGLLAGLTVEDVGSRARVLCPYIRPARRFVVAMMIGRALSMSSLSTTERSELPFGTYYATAVAKLPEEGLRRGYRSTGSRRGAYFWQISTGPGSTWSSLLRTDLGTVAVRGRQCMDAAPRGQSE